jgi:hypothetical protein
MSEASPWVHHTICFDLFSAVFFFPSGVGQTVVIVIAAIGLQPHSTRRNPRVRK